MVYHICSILTHTRSLPVQIENALNVLFKVKLWYVTVFAIRREIDWLICGFYIQKPRCDYERRSGGVWKF